MTLELEAIFQRDKILTISQVKDILSTRSRMTAFRYLRKRHAMTSYSHKGMFYTLPEVPEFDDFGLWSYGNVHFSRHGTLLETIGELVRLSASGYTVAELEIQLQVYSQNAVKQLLDRGVLSRTNYRRGYVYFAPGKAREQLASRKRESPDYGRLPAEWGQATEKILDHLSTFLTMLNEKQKRLYLGLESLKLGYGGDIQIANLTGVNVKTVARGREELQSRGITREQVRDIGAGRPPTEKKTT